jgi:acyl-CoA thioesterase FadM
MPDLPFTPLERPITFADTDAAGVAHFSRLAVIVEEAIHRLFQSRDIPVHDATTAWPIVSLHIDFAAPLRFGDTVHLHLRPEKIGSTSLTWRFEAIKPLNESPTFSGTLTQCHLNPATGTPAPIPDQYRTLLAAESFQFSG